MMCWPLSTFQPSLSTTRARPPITREDSNTVTRTSARASVTAQAKPA